MFALLLAVMAAGLIQRAGAQAPSLRSAGPMDIATGFASWYQDSKGLRLSPCIDNSGNCLAVIPDATQPVLFPDNFPDEFFYWSAGSTLTTNGGGKALLTMAMEGAFAGAGDVAPGAQMTFGRVRLRIDNLVSGQQYTITYPYGTLKFTAAGSGVKGINNTNDIGCLGVVPGLVSCDFTLALASPLDPFLTWDTFGLTPAQGGPPQGYVGDPNVAHLVVGSPTKNNLFKIQGKSVGGPGIDVIQTSLFTVEGKISGLNASVAPRGGAFNTAQTVRLGSSDPAAKLFYTLDGSDASVSPTRLAYTAPLTIAADTTLSYVAELTTAGVVTRSAVGTESYTIDTIPPGVTVTPIGGSYNSNQVVTVTASEPATIYYSLNGTDPTSAQNANRFTYTGPLPVSTDTTFTFGAVDTVGNPSAPVTHSYLIDKVPPAVPSGPDLQASSDTGVSNSDKITSERRPIFTGTAEVDATVNLIVDNGIVNGSTIVASTGLYFVMPATPLTDGTHAIRVQAVDRAGNASTASPTALSVRIDGTAPVITLTPQATVVSASTPLSFTFGSAEAGLSFECSLTANGVDTFQSCVSPKAYPAQASGTVTFSVRSADVAGNVGLSKVNVLVDTVPPIVTATPGAGSYNQTQHVVLQANEAASIYYTVDGTAPTTLSPLYSSAISISDPTTLQYIAVDTVGNQSAIGTQQYTFDTVAPTVSAAPAGGLFGAAQVVTLTASEPAAIYYTLDGSDPTASSAKYAAPLTIGANKTLKFVAIDPATNASAIATEVYTIDTTAPSVTVTPKGTPFNAPIAVTLAPSEAGHIYYTLDGADPVLGGQEYTTAIPIADTTTLKYLAVDTLGNVSQIGSETYTLDQTAPAVSASPAGGAFNSPQSVTLNSEPGAVIYYTADGTAPDLTSPKYTTPIAVGQDTTLRFVAVDVAGNVSAAGSEAYVIDTVLPSVSASPAGKLYNAAQSVTLTSTKPGSIFYTVDGSAPTTASAVYSTPLTISADTVLKFFALDGVNNASPVSTETYRIDTVPPTVTASPGSGAFTVVSVSLTASEPAEIHFTLDGTAPTVSSAIYSAPITLSGSSTVRFMAIDAAGNPSAPSSATYTILGAPGAPDLTAASDSGASSTDNITNVTVPQFTGAAAPNATVLLLVDGVNNGTTTASAGGAYTVSPATALSAGTHAIAAAIKDGAGNIGTPGSALNVTIDTAAPTVTMGATPTNPATSADLSFAFTVGESGTTVSCALTLSGGTDAFQACTSPKAYTGVANGAYTFTARAVDTAGNAGVASATLTVSVPQLVAVPAVAGLTQAAASTAITGAGLTVGTVTTQNSATVASGSVISSSPAAGVQAVVGSAVALVVSSGPAPVAVPNVVGLTQAAATTAITSAGLTVGTITTQNSSTVASGSVISSSPTAGTQVPPSSAVNLVVSSGPAPVPVPNVVGLTQAAATTAITSAGLTVGTITTQNSSTVASGSVISSSPTAGTQVLPASAVNLVVSSGPPPVQTVGVPAVAGSTQAAATTAITNAGLTLGTITTQTSTTVASGSVISSTPAAGTQVLPGSAVNLVVSTGSLPAGWSTQDIGAVGAVGSASFAPDTYTLKGAGADIWGTADALRYAYQPVTGDFQVTARVASEQNVSVWVKGGVMIRQSVAAGSQQAMMMVTPGKSNNFQRRVATNGVSTSTTGAVVTAPYWVRLSRVGNTITASQSANGTTWTVVGTDTIVMTPNVLVGLAVSSHVAATLATVTFDNFNLNAVTAPSPTVPTVAGLTQAAAITAITNAGLTVGTITQQNSSTVAAGSVIGSTPAAGTQVAPNSAVNLVVSSGPAVTTVAVPSVVGLTQAAASTAITNATLVVGTVTQQSSSTVATGNVISSTPAAGTQVASGSAVNLVVSSGAPVGGPLPTGWATQDIGSVGVAGSATFAANVYTVKGAGADIGGTADAFRFASLPLNGDGQITARVATFTGGAAAEAGVMIRDTTAAGSLQAALLLTPGGGTSFQRRLTANGATTATAGTTAVLPGWVRIARVGNTFTASRSTNGTTWTVVGTATIAMGPNVQLGLAVSSHSTAAAVTATFDNVDVTNLWSNQDIGAVGLAGSTSITNGVFTVTGAGADIWGTADAFHYTYQQLTGNGQITAQVTSLTAVNAWHKVGVMIRNDLTAGSAQATMLVSSSKGLAFQRRVTANGVSTNTAGPLVTAPRWVRIARAGNVITASYSNDGTTWTVVGTDTITMGTTVFVGIANSSHTTTALGTASVTNVTR